MIGPAIVVVDSEISKTSLIDPRTGEGMKIPIIGYLAGSFTSIEALQKRVRDKIHLYHISAGI